LQGCAVAVAVLEGLLINGTIPFSANAAVGASGYSLAFVLSLPLPLPACPSRWPRRAGPEAVAPALAIRHTVSSAPVYFGCAVGKPRVKLISEWT